MPDPRTSTAYPRGTASPDRLLSQIRQLPPGAKTCRSKLASSSVRAYRSGVGSQARARVRSRTSARAGTSPSRSAALSQASDEVRMFPLRIVRLHVTHHRRDGRSANGGGARNARASRPLDEFAGVREVRGGDAERARGRQHDQPGAIPEGADLRDEPLLDEERERVKFHAEG